MDSMDVRATATDAITPAAQAIVRTGNASEHRRKVPVRSMDALAAAVDADLRFAQTRTRAFDGCVRSMQSPATANPTVPPAAHANAPLAEANARVRQTFARAMHAAMRASYAGAPCREADRMRCTG